MQVLVNTHPRKFGLVKQAMTYPLISGLQVLLFTQWLHRDCHLLEYVTFSFLLFRCNWYMYFLLILSHKSVHSVAYHQVISLLFMLSSLVYPFRVLKIAKTPRSSFVGWIVVTNHVDGLTIVCVGSSALGLIWFGNWIAVYPYWSFFWNKIQENALPLFKRCRILGLTPFETLSPLSTVLSKMSFCQDLGILEFWTITPLSSPRRKLCGFFEVLTSYNSTLANAHFVYNFCSYSIYFAIFIDKMSYFWCIHIMQFMIFTSRNQYLTGSSHEVRNQVFKPIQTNGHKKLEIRSSLI